MGKVLLIFLDGVGIGEKDEVKNPFFKYPFATFENLFGGTPHLGKQKISKDGKFIFPIDARLGIAGIPQSGTGQVAIFTGENAAAIAGKHFGPFPYSTTIPILEKKNIFADVLKIGKKPFFANAYPKIYFDYIKRGGKRLNVTARMALASGVRLQTLEDLRNSRALSNEITNFRWVRNLNYKLKIIKPQTAARRLIRLALRNDLTLYEFYLTDHLGHWRLKDLFQTIYRNLDSFLSEILISLPDELTLLVCSDHGNFEDISVKTHTLNPALGIAAGKGAEKLNNNVRSLIDIKKSLLEILS